MESQRQISLFSWIYDESSDTFEYRGKPFVRYHEASAPQQQTRVRIVYDNREIQAQLASILVTLDSPVAVAQIKRQAGLFCIELSLTEPLSRELQDRFASMAGVELLSISELTPRLDRVGLLVMDMDSTAIQIECIDELAVMAGVGAAVAEVTERAMQGELDFEQSLRARVAQLAGADAEIIDKLCARLPLMPGLKAMVSELQSHRWRLVLASGGFTPFVGHLKQLLSLDAAYANELVIEAGKLKGEVTGTVVDAQFKADMVLKAAKEWQIPSGQRLAIGDGANDIPMVQSADFGIAYHAKPKLRAAADAVIDKLDLRILPYMLRDLS